jgi:phosphoglucomutase/phosphomannomutase
LEEKGCYEDVTATTADFVIGCEESHGAQMMAQIRDKDAAAAALVLAELALDSKRRGVTMPQHLDSLYRKHGYHKNVLKNIFLSGIEGKSQMVRMLDDLRRDPPMSVAGLAVTAFEDLRDESGRMGPLKGGTDAAGRNFLIWRFGDRACIALRPSGTEPKAKAYVEVCSPPSPPSVADAEWRRQCAEIDTLAEKLSAEFVTVALARVGLKP